MGGGRDASAAGASVRSYLLFDMVPPVRFDSLVDGWSTAQDDAWSLDDRTVRIHDRNERNLLLLCYRTGLVGIRLLLDRRGIRHHAGHVFHAYCLVHGASLPFLVLRAHSGHLSDARALVRKCESEDSLLEL